MLGTHFEASLIYRASSRTAGVTHRETLSQNQKEESSLLIMAVDTKGKEMD